MRTSKIRLAALALVSGITLGGCAYGFDPYGYGGGVSVGYGSGYGYGYGPYGYYDPRYSGYGYGYGGYYGSPFGWYGNYYYPGTGIYVYDRYRTRYVWNDSQRRYWRDRHDRWRDRGDRDHNKENWSGFGRGVREWANRNDLSGSTTTTNSTSSRRNRSVERSSVTTSSDRGVRRVRVERRERNRDRSRDD